MNGLNVDTGGESFRFTWMSYKARVWYSQIIYVGGM